MHFPIKLILLYSATEWLLVRLTLVECAPLAPRHGVEENRAELVGESLRKVALAAAARVGDHLEHATKDALPLARRFDRVRLGEEALRWDVGQWRRANINLVPLRELPHVLVHSCQLRVPHVCDPLPQPPHRHPLLLRPCLAAFALTLTHVIVVVGEEVDASHRNAELNLAPLVEVGRLEELEVEDCNRWRDRGHVHGSYGSPLL